MGNKPGRNESCPCGSGKKFKKNVTARRRQRQGQRPPTVNNGIFRRRMRRPVIRSPDLSKSTES
jgi:hypothetical protein